MTTLPGLDEGAVGIAAVAHLRLAVADELVDVALVVGEQHEALEMLGIGAGVVEQALQRQIDALGAEQRQAAGARPLPA